MKFLIITQKININDPILGFFVNWVKEFSKHCEKVTVICLEKGDYDLPENVKVLSLGKESGKSRIKYLCRFYKYIWQERKNYDKVFVHMNQIYIILVGFFWRLNKKKIGLWYAHGSVRFSLKIAEKLSHNIFTSTPEGFRLESKKKTIVGQGIDTKLFCPNKDKVRNTNLTLVTVGRVSKDKDYRLMIDTIEVLIKEKGVKCFLNIIGGPVLPDDEKYLDSLKKEVKKRNLADNILFLGPMSNQDIVPHLQSADIFINTSKTGSLDKAMVEALSCGLPVITVNKAVRDLIESSGNSIKLINSKKEDLVKSIIDFNNLLETNRERISIKARELVISHSSLDNLITKIIGRYNRNND